MLELFTTLSALARLIPNLTAGGIPTAAMPGDTDMMATSPAATPQTAVGSVVASDPRIDRTTFKLGASEYMRQETTKRQIVLHFTAGGSAAGAVNSWKNDGRTVATAYVVDLNGNIFETFDPRFWAFALGVKHSLSRPSEQGAIQIEIVGWGPLKRVGNDLCSWPKNWTNRFCGVDETWKYVKSPFRGIEYFSAFPDVQIEAIAALVRSLCRRFDIPTVVPPLDMRGVANVVRAHGHRGIVAHENYRQDKWDVGPAFPWVRFEQLIRRAS